MGENQKIKNVVHEDEIWRQTVKFEKDTAQQWKNNWGFMTDSLYGHKDLNKKQKSFLPEIDNTGSVFPVRKNRKRPPIIKDFLLTYQIEKAMTYEPPIKNYSYPYSTNTEIGWPWCDDNSNINSNTVNNDIFNYLPKCQCRNGNISAVNNEEIVNDTESDKCLSNNNNESSNVINSKQFLRNERLIDKIQKHGSDQYRLRNPMRWWGGCIESLP